MTVGTETFTSGIITVIDAATAPVAVTLDAEMVVALSGQGTHARSTLQKALRKGNAGRNLIALHLLHSQGGILTDVLVVTTVAPLGLSRQHTGQQAKEKGNYLQVSIHRYFVSSYQLPATSYKLRATSYGLRATGYELQVSSYWFNFGLIT